MYAVNVIVLRLHMITLKLQSLYDYPEAWILWRGTGEISTIAINCIGGLFGVIISAWVLKSITGKFHHTLAWEQYKSKVLRLYILFWTTWSLKYLSAMYSTTSIKLLMVDKFSYSTDEYDQIWSYFTVNLRLLTLWRFTCEVLTQVIGRSEVEPVVEEAVWQVTFPHNISLFIKVTNNNAQGELCAIYLK